jgi:membrane protein YdbS with pleckstrin-like domain
MEEQKEDKYFHTENVSKNVITTIIGSVLMIISAVAICMNWFFELKQIPVMQVAIVGAVGFALLFMRDKVSSYLDVFVRRKIDNSK